MPEHPYQLEWRRRQTLLRDIISSAGLVPRNVLYILVHHGLVRFLDAGVLRDEATDGWC